MSPACLIHIPDNPFAPGEQVSDLSLNEQSAAAKPTATPAFRLDIEALRALAILLVVAYHAHLPGFGGGYIGVDVFFVLSGYLITGLLVREIRSTGRLDLVAFYVRRILRLLPAAITVVVATLLIGRIVFPPVDHRVLANSGVATSLYLSNVYFARAATDYLGTPDTNPLLHTWSLAVEEQFYLFWPMLVLLMLTGLRGRPRPRHLAAGMVGLAAVSFGLCVWLTWRSQPWAFFLLPTRAWEFAVGALVRMVPDRWVRAPLHAGGVIWVGLIMTVAAGTQFGADTVFPGAAAMLPVMGTGLMLAGGASDSRAGPFRVLVNPPMLWLGRLSYSWYLWHWPVLIFAREFPALRGGMARAGMVALSLGLAALTHVLIENPIRFNRRLRSQRRLALALAVVLTTSGAGLSMAVRVMGARDAVSPGQIIFTQARDLPVIYTNGCHQPLEATEAVMCEFGDTSAAQAIVLFGDSHAAQWFPALEQISRERHLKLITLTKSACPTASVDLASREMGGTFTQCTTWRADAIREILELRPLAVVMSSFSGYIRVPGASERWMTSEEEWREGMNRTVATLDSAGIYAILLADTPAPGFDVPTCLGRVAWSPSLYHDTCEFSSTTPAAEISRRIDAEVAAPRPYAEVVDLNSLICPSERCTTRRGDMIRFRDASHLTTRFAASLAPALADRLPFDPDGS